MTSQPNPLPSDAPVHSLDPLGLELRRAHEDRWAAILPNTAPGQGPVKLQYFGPTGLAGHRAFATPQAAYRAAQRSGYTAPDRGALRRLSQTPAWQVIYDTPAPPAPAAAMQRVRRALAVLERCGVTVEAITLRGAAVPPRIVISGRAPAFPWRCYAWGCDARGRYRRFAAALAGCQLVREVRDGPRGGLTRR